MTGLLFGAWVAFALGGVAQGETGIARTISECVADAPGACAALAVAVDQHAAADLTACTAGDAAACWASATRAAAEPPWVDDGLAARARLRACGANLSKPCGDERSLVLTPDAILLDDKPVLGLSQGAPPKDAVDSAGRLEALTRALQAGGAAPEVLAISASPAVPYGLVAAVMRTSGMAGVAQYRLAIGDGRVVPLVLPALPPEAPRLGAGPNGLRGDPRRTLVLGPEDKALITEAFRQNGPAFAVCGATTPSGKLSGRALAVFEIRADGSVHDARLEASSLPSADAEACVLKALSGIAFPTTMGDGVVNVRYPLVFSIEK